MGNVCAVFVPGCVGTTRSQREDAPSFHAKPKYSLPAVMAIYTCLRRLS